MIDFYYWPTPMVKKSRCISRRPASTDRSDLRRFFDFF